MTECIICSKRRARSGAICHNCQAKIDAEKKRRVKAHPEHYLTYRGFTVGLFRSEPGRLRAELLGVSPERLPKSRTLDLNKYLSGYDRAIIKRFKACVLELANK